jgi:hypothetical protein
MKYAQLSYRGLWKRRQMCSWQLPMAEKKGRGMGALLWNGSAQGASKTPRKSHAVGEALKLHFRGYRRL